MMLWHAASWVHRAVWAGDQKFNGSFAGILGDLKMHDVLNLRGSGTEIKGKFLITLNS